MDKDYAEHLEELYKAKIREFAKQVVVDLTRITEEVDRMVNLESRQENVYTLGQELDHIIRWGIANLSLGKIHMYTGEAANLMTQLKEDDEH